MFSLTFWEAVTRRLPPTPWKILGGFSLTFEGGAVARIGERGRPALWRRHSMRLTSPLIWRTGSEMGGCRRGRTMPRRASQINNKVLQQFWHQETLWALRLRGLKRRGP